MVPKMTKRKFVIIITIKKVGRSIGFWSLEKTSTGEIIFSLVNLIDKSNKTRDIYYNIGDELSEFDHDRV